MDAKNIQALLTEADGFYSAHSDVMNLVCGLAAALKASEEQNGAIRRGLDWERAEREKVAEFARKIGRERDDLAAANIAANKRIAELEHERDEAQQQLRKIGEAYNAECSAGGEPPPALTCMLLALKQIRDQKQQMRDGFNCLMAERDAARAEIARLTTPSGEPLDMDCGDNCCMFAAQKGGMRTNGGCRCLESLGFRRGPHDALRKMAAEIVAMRKRLSDLTTPRPIAEAPRDGTRILAYMPSTETWMVLVWLVRKECWACPDFPHVGYYDPAEYLPLPEVKP